MVLKIVKYGSIGLAGVTIVGLLVLGPDILSYARTSVSQVRATAKDAVPMDFELARARDMVKQIVPELQANIRLIAQEEVEIASLSDDIEHSSAALDNQRVQITRVRQVLDGSGQRVVLAGQTYQREQLTEELARIFDHFKEGEMMLEGKRRLRQTREKSLAAAMRMLDQARAKKSTLEDRIASLEAQYRLVKAASAGAQFQIDDSKLAQTERLIGDIKKRLDVAERMMAHEGRFAQGIVFDEPIDEQELMAQVDEYFQPVAQVEAVLEAEVEPEQEPDSDSTLLSAKD